MRSLSLFLSLVVLLLARLGPPVRGQETEPGSTVYAKASKSVYLVLVESKQGTVVGQGTGFLVADGKVITNEHVVRAGTVYIEAGVAKVPAIVETVDEFNDLAVLTTSAELLSQPLTFADALPEPRYNQKLWMRA